MKKFTTTVKVIQIMSNGSLKIFFHLELTQAKCRLEFEVLQTHILSRIPVIEVIFLTNFYADFSQRWFTLSVAPGLNNYLIIFDIFLTIEKYSSEHGYLSPANGPGAPGKYTNRPGTLAFYEICDVTNKWYLRVVRDHESKEMFPNSLKFKYFTPNLNLFAKIFKLLK